MASASVTNTFVNGTAADAIQVNTNFADLVTFLNNQVVHRDGTKALTANWALGGFKLTGLAAGSANGDSVRFEDAIKAAIVDVKGDLIAATAADAVSRLAVGANGLVLTADSAEATGLKWVAGAGTSLHPNAIQLADGLTIPKRAGIWVPAGGGPKAADSIPAPTLNIITYVGPFRVGGAMNVDSLGLRCNTVGGSFRLAIYEGDSITGLPKTLLQETVSTASVGNTNHDVAIASQALAAGKLYWLACNFSTSGGSFTHYSADFLHSGNGGWTVPQFSNSNATKFTEAFAYGAYPATATPVAVAVNTATSSMPIVWAQFV